MTQWFSWRAARRAVMVLCAAGLAAACGGGGGEPTVPTVGAAGGVVTGAAGAQVSVPAGALSADTPVAVAQSSAGAPAMPAGASFGSEVFALTPHGTRFAAPVTVRIPVDAARVAAGLVPTLYKTGDSGDWEPVPGATVAGGYVTAQVSSFSWFAFFAWPPVITAQPRDLAVTAPAPATFEVTAIGSPPFTYQWQRSDDASTWADLPGATAARYTIASTSAVAAGAGGDHGARLRVRVSNADGTTTSAGATLNVTEAVAAPAITTQPANTAAAPGADAAFAVAATGPALAYQWQRSNDGGTNWLALAGETNASVLLRSVQPADSGALLRVIVSNGGGSITSAGAVLTVTPGGGGAAASAIVGAGYEWTLALRADGSMASWGGSGSGRLGAGAGAVNRSAPGPVTAPTGMDPIAAVSVGGAHAVALTRSGEAWAWGSSGFGEVGDGGLDNRHTPVRVTSASPASRYQAASAGAEHTLLLRTDGRVEGAGYNALGQLGLPSAYLSQVFVEMPGGGSYRAIAAGGFFSLALRDDGTLWAFGQNSFCQLGNLCGGGTSQSAAPVRVLYVPQGPATMPRALAAGLDHALAIDHTGEVWAWGQTDNGKLGFGGTVGRWALPARVNLSGNFIAVAAGEQHSLALRDDGVVFAWGIDETGQLGQGRALGMSVTPLPVGGLPPIKAIAAGLVGLGHSVAVGRDGSVWTWGRGNSGQLGNGATQDRDVPVQVPGLNLN